MRAVIYVRVSKVGDRDAETYRTEADQEATGRAIAATAGYEIAEVIVERDVSGGTISPGRERAVAMIERGEAQVLIAAHSDRLARDTELALAIRRRVATAGGRVVSADQDFDSSTDSGRMLTTFMAAIAAYERDRRKSGFHKAQQAAAAEGAHCSRVPYGYRNPRRSKRDPVRPLEVVPDEAENVRRAFAMRAAGVPVVRIMDMLAAAGHKRTEANVRKMFRCKTYIGMAYGAGAWHEGAHDPIVERELWDVCQRFRAVKSGSTGRLTSQARLRGQVYCAACGHAMNVTGHGGNNKSRADRQDARYACKQAGCVRPSIRCATLDEYADQQYLTRNHPVVWDAIDQRQDRVALEAAEGELAAFLLNVPATTPGYAAAIAQRQAAIDELRVKAAETSPYVTAGKSNLQIAVDRVTVAKSTRRNLPPAEHVGIDWRVAA